MKNFNIKKLSILLALILLFALPLLLIVVKHQQNINSRAAAPDQLEAEGGILGGNAKIQTDSLASGGQYVALGTSLTPTPTPNPITNAFYVSPTGSDSNPGTQVSPWKTIQKAANTLTAGQTAIVLDGTYTQAQITFANNGTPTNPITIKAQNKWGAILASTSSTFCSPSFSIDKSWITIDGIRITTAPGAVNGCSSPSSANGAARCWGTNDHPNPANPSTGTVGCTFRNVKVDYSAVKDVGIKTNQDYALVENSEIHNSIEAFNSFSPIYRNNVVYGSDVWGTSIFGKGGVRNMQIYNNIVHNGNGVLIGGAAGGSTSWDDVQQFEAYNSVAYDNVVINESGTGVTVGIGMNGAVDSAVFNNVIIGGVIYLWSGSTPTAKSTNPTFKNNIVVCNNTAATNGGWGWDWLGTLTTDYNLFYNCTGGVPSQTHPITGNPNFVNSASDWHLNSGSPAIGTGIPVTFTGYNGEVIDVSKNFDGLIRTAPWNLSIY